MKVLIWVAWFVVVTLLQMTLGLLIGYGFGYLLLYIILFFPARALCRKCDEHVLSKKIVKSGMSTIEYIKQNSEQSFIDHFEKNRGRIVELTSTLQQAVKDKYITKLEYNILLQEYMH